MDHQHHHMQTCCKHTNQKECAEKLMRRKAHWGHQVLIPVLVQEALQSPHTS